MASLIKVDKLDPQSGTALEIGTSGDTVTVPSGVTLTTTNATLNLPTTITSTTEVKTNKVSPATGTAFALGDSGDTFTVPAGATIDNLGTATGIWYDDDVIQSNIAVLGFKVATNGSLAKYNLVDQAIDEYEDTSGVDAGASTNEVRDGSGKYYSGSGTASPTISGNYDDSGTDGSYSWYKWTTVTASGSYTTDVAQDYEYLVVGGGGGGGSGWSGSAAGGAGGGAGGFRANAAYDFAVAATTISGITVGDGGATLAENAAQEGYSGEDSVFSTITADGGGGGGTRWSDTSIRDGLDGGSGGGGAYSTGAGGSATVGQGNDGGTNDGGTGASGGGGAGGAGGVNSTQNGGAGGAGSASDIIETSTNVTYAGGGGGGSGGGAAGAGGSGGGGAGGADNGVGANGSDGLGGGGGGDGTRGDNSGSGGSGIVIIRRETSPTVNLDMTLQSVDTSAEDEPDKSDMVMLIENATGTATLNTDIKGYISRDSGSNFTQGTLVDEGSWGTNKKILAFHDLDISAQPSGTSMCYKIETLNQGVSKDTRIYATSMGWR